MGESLHVLESGSQFEGSRAQNAIYLAGGSEWPISPEEWETRARETLARGPFDYVAGGAGSETTMRANRETFERRRLRPRMLVGTAEHGYLPFLTGEGLAQFFSDPLFRERLDAPPEEDMATASLVALATFPNLGLTWADLAWLRERTPLPVLVKGVLTAEDARLALDAGVDGLVVSNHGGRQVDGAVAALDALVEVRDAVGAEATVLMDGGIRRGSDVLKALALGADAVLLGRLYVWGLAVGGQPGVAAVVRQLAAELDLTCALAGVPVVARETDRSLVT